MRPRISQIPLTGTLKIIVLYALQINLVSLSIKAVLILEHTLSEDMYSKLKLNCMRKKFVLVVDLQQGIYMSLLSSHMLSFILATLILH